MLCNAQLWPKRSLIESAEKNRHVLSYAETTNQPSCYITALKLSVPPIWFYTRLDE